MNNATTSSKALGPLPRWIFMSRWLQAPLYLGLIVAQGLYVWQFWTELIHLIIAIAFTEKLTHDTAVAQKHHKNDSAAPIPQPGV